MWLIVGIAPIVFALLNILYVFQNKNAKWLRFLSISFTALAVCSFYSDAAILAAREDWDGLIDVMPSTSKALWVCVILSIMINSISLFKENK